jgi:hypothetical protein
MQPSFTPVPVAVRIVEKYASAFLIPMSFLRSRSVSANIREKASCRW